MMQLRPHYSSSFDETGIKLIEDEWVIEANQLQLGWSSSHPRYIQLRLIIQAEQADYLLILVWTYFNEPNFISTLSVAR